MPQDGDLTEGPADEAPLARLTPDSPGLTALVAEAAHTWAARSGDPQTAPGWRPFEDAFPTFYQFTNKPR